MWWLLLDKTNEQISWSVILDGIEMAEALLLISELSSERKWHAASNTILRFVLRVKPSHGILGPDKGSLSFTSALREHRDPNSRSLALNILRLCIRIQSCNFYFPAALAAVLGSI